MRVPIRLVAHFFFFYMIKTLFIAHRNLWSTDFGRAWGRLSLDKKLIVILVLNHTIAILTLIEMLIFKR